MDGIENILYVVIAIGWFAWNTYRKMKGGKQNPAKPQTRRTQPTDASTEKDPFKSLEEMILEQFEGVEELKPEPVATTAHHNQDKFLNKDLTHSHLPDDYQMSQDESKSHRVERQVRVLEREEEQEESLIDVVLPNGFDLRQAVVVDAVLNRPYS